MEELRRLKLSQAKNQWDFLPETLEEAEAMVASIERAVQAETGYGVRNLHVTIDREHVILSGTCDSFHCKQLAQHAAMGLSRVGQVVNSICVDE